MEESKELQEIVDIRHYDGIDYLPPQAFKSLYPITGPQLGEGAYGKVFPSKQKYVIKVFEEDPKLSDFAIELNIYASISHPCIMKPVAWTVQNNIGYLVMKKGESIIKAYKDNKISIEEIISDSLSAIAFMNSRGIFHADIKPANLVYHKGQCKVIDMGISRKGEFNSDGNYYLSGIAYTENYRDPEYFSQQLNNIKSEIYALGSTYMQILEDEVPSFGDLYKYSSGIPHIEWFISRAKRFINQRPSIKKLLRDAPPQLIVRRYTGLIYRQPIITPDPKCTNVLAILLFWLIELALKYNFKIETLFLVCHLIHRTFRPIFIQYGNTNNHVQFYGCVCLHLATCVNFDYILPLLDWKKLSIDIRPDAVYEIAFNKMVIDILNVTRGVVSTLTYWDYAKSREDLIPLLHDIMKCNYNPNLIRITEANVISNKCVRTQSVLKLTQIPKYIKGVTNMWEPLPETEGSIIHPCELDLDDDVTKIEFIWDHNWLVKDRAELIAVILHNRFVLSELNINVARRICKVLYGRRDEDLIELVLNTICYFDWENRIDDVLASNLHPFKIGHGDIIPIRAGSTSQSFSISSPSDMI